MSPSASVRPVSVVVSALSSAALAGLFAVMAVASLSSGHGQFSAQVAAMLLVWAVIVAVAAWGLWGLRGWARGVVVGTGLLHTAAFGQFALNQPLAWLGALVGLVAVVGAVWPSTTQALRLDR